MEKVNGGLMKPAAGSDLDFVTVTTEALCQSCAFWHARDDLKQETGVQGGECRFNPPNIFEVTVQTRLGNAQGFQSVWPIVGSGNWCGKHPKRDAKVRAAIVQSFFEVAAEKTSVFGKLLEKAGVVLR